MTEGFFERVYDIVGRVPPGRAIGYGDIARLLGDPRAARQVGWAMRACPEHLPWHRVVRTDGTISTGDADLARALLDSEGVPFTPDGRVDMDACRWP